MQNFGRASAGAKIFRPQNYGPYLPNAFYLSQRSMIQYLPQNLSTEPRDYDHLHRFGVQLRPGLKVDVFICGSDVLTCAPRVFEITAS